MSEQTARPTLQVSPARPLLDEEVTVRVTDLPSDATVRVRLRERVEDRVFGSAAAFVADDEGIVDLATDAPRGGDYDGVEPMGLFQFATERPDADPDGLGAASGSGSESGPGSRSESGPGSRSESGSDSGSGADTDASGAVVFPGKVEAVVDGTVVDAVGYERVVRPASVEKRAVEHPDLVGDVYLPDGEGPHPGVLYFGGSEGGRPGEVLASLLAARGYAVFGLAYFRVEDLPNNLVDIPVEYFETAVEWFGDRETVQTEPMGVLSASRGSEMALNLGATVLEVRAVVAYAPSDVLFGGIYTGKPDEWGPPGAAWTRDGDPLEYVPVASSPFDLLGWFWHGLRGRPVEIDHTYVDGRAGADPATVEAATVPVEDTGDPVLLLSGEDDRLWPATEMADRIVERLGEADYEHRFEHHSYPDAGHAIAVPYLPVTDRETTPLFPGVEMAYGGTPGGYAGADADSWPRVLDALAEGLD